MNITLIILLLPLIQFYYLVDIFEQQIRKRNYLKLFKNRRYLVLQLLISLMVIAITLPFQLDDKNLHYYFPTLGLFFIVVAFSLNHISIKIQQRPFNLYLRGDNVKWISYDMLFSYLQFLLPWLFAILTELFLKQLINS